MRSKIEVTVKVVLNTLFSQASFGLAIVRDFSASVKALVCIEVVDKLCNLLKVLKK